MNFKIILIALFLIGCCKSEFVKSNIKSIKYDSFFETTFIECKDKRFFRFTTIKSEIKSIKLAKELCNGQKL